MKEEKKFNIETIEQKIAFIESVLFVSKEPVEPEKIMTFLKCKNIKDFEEIISKLTDMYKDSKRGIILKRSGGGLQLVTKIEMHDLLNDFFKIKKTSTLTIPSLETLSIVSYKQPVTLAEISRLRGVNSVGPAKNLLQKKLIALYSTTREFLLYFGLNDISELPSIEELTEMFEEKEQPSLFNYSDKDSKNNR
jgi:segregation and condensation protein B